MIEEGEPFPDFSLLNQDGQAVTRADLLGATSVIYFYPKDDTSGCTAEACEFQERLPNIPGVRVIGVSPDSVRSHRKFADKYGLKFTLLSDPERTLIAPLGLWVEKTLYGRKYMGVDRTTYILDAEGRILRVFRKVKPQGHAAEVSAALP